MGNTNNPNQPLQKGQGYRIITIQKGSPFQGKIDVFFDFIVQVIPPQSQQSLTQVPNKLSGAQNRNFHKPLLQILNENVDKNIKIKVVSTKFRKVRMIEIIPNNQWSGSNDLIGITVRRERFDQAFDTYFPLIDIKVNSPIKKAGIKQGQYLIGCIEYSYKSLDLFVEGLYQRFFDKQVTEKVVHLAIYDILTDTLSIKDITLSRGWGGKGFLGCQFLQGLLNKFPSNLEQNRQNIQKHETKESQISKMRNQLGNYEGASKILVQSLQSIKSKKQHNYKNLRNLLNAEPPKLDSLKKEPHFQLKQNPIKQQINLKDTKIDQLEIRIAFLQNSFKSLQNYFSQHKQESLVEDLNDN